MRRNAAVTVFYKVLYVMNILINSFLVLDINWHNYLLRVFHRFTLNETKIKAQITITTICKIKICQTLRRNLQRHRDEEVGSSYANSHTVTFQLSSIPHARIQVSKVGEQEVV